MGVEGGQDGLGEGVAHDDQPVDLLGFDRVEELDRVEWREGRVTTRPPSLEALDGGERTGAVHERARRQQGHPRSAAVELGPDVVDAAVVGIAAEAAAVEPGEQIVLSPHDALGHAGGAAGVEHVDVVGTPAPRGRAPAR